jgi:hypothetical protein
LARRQTLRHGADGASRRFVLHIGQNEFISRHQHKGGDYQYKRSDTKQPLSSHNAPSWKALLPSLWCSHRPSGTENRLAGLHLTPIVTL